MLKELLRIYNVQENCWIWHSLINNTVLLNETFTLKVLFKYKLIKYQNTSESWINCLSRNRETESGCWTGFVCVCVCVCVCIFFFCSSQRILYLNFLKIQLRTTWWFVLKSSLSIVPWWKPKKEETILLWVFISQDSFLPIIFDT